MDGKTSQSLIAELERVRKSRVVSYLTSDRVPFAAKIALDVLPFFYSTLQSIGKTQKISLFLYSAGGNLEAPWPIVNLIREYCNEFEVLIPFRALSAATLLSLGANRIVMTPLSLLSPIDPEGTFILEGKTQQIAVEDVLSYVDFAKEKIGIAESQPLSEVLRLLTNEIKPQIIGSLNRSHALIRRLARIMLQFHLTEPKYETQINEIVNNLTQLLYSHNHLMNRREARDTVGFHQIIEYPEPDTENPMNELFKLYGDALELAIPFDPAKVLGQQTEVDFKIRQAYIESREMSHVFETPLKAKLDPATHQVNVQQSATPAWITTKSA